MNDKKMWEQKIAETANTPACARADDLVAYLYGEASVAETKAFQNHMQQCTACRAEIAEFGQVREAIGEWRQQSLGMMTSPASEANSAPAFDAMNAGATRKRSALVAIREFFTLAPNWMRAATAMASILVCALLIIAVSHFTQRPQPVVVVSSPAPKEVASPNLYTHEQLEAAVETRLKEHDAALQKQQNSFVAKGVNVAVNQPPRQSLKRSNFRDSGTLARRSNLQTGPHSITEQERQELAEVLLQPTAIAKDEESLPRLSDLLDDSDEPN